MYHKLSLFLFAVAAPLVNGLPAADEFDYIVVGSGPGGGPLAANLARAGYSTLLLEAGDDQGENPTAAELFNFNIAANDPYTRWDFWSKHSDDPARELKFEHMTWRQPDGEFYVGLEPPAGSKQLGIWYPRAGTLGGCAMHNAGVSALPAEEDWNIVAKRTGDSSWLASNMTKYFIKLEKNEIFPKGTPGHGFDGWLSLATLDTSWARNDTDSRKIMVALAKATNQDPNNLEKLVSQDANDPLDVDRDDTVGFFSMAQHMDKNTMRSSPNNYIRATLKDPAKYPLTVKLNSLVTKVLFDEKAASPTAKGVEVLEGPSMYSADPRFVKEAKGKVIQYTAKREVIVSGGTFNSPQILKLSGIGPANELKKFNIPVVKDLPGVGENMADNYEAGIIGLANKTLTGFAGQASIMLKTGKATKRNIYVKHTLLINLTRPLIKIANLSSIGLVRPIFL
jgi:choline dehydrogenase